MEKKLHLYRAIPSLLTLSAFVFGFNAILLSINGQIKAAIISIIISGFIDLFDGRLARKLGTSSKFGAELDSLSDLVCFGIATSLVIIFYSDSYSKMLNIGVIFFSIASMIRLARFNLDICYPSYYSNFFVGVPTPSGFLLGVLPISFDFAFGYKIPVIAYSIYLIFVGFLMISTIPTLSTKSIKIDKSYFPVIIGLITLFIIFIFFYAWILLSVTAIIYLISIVITLIIFQKNKSNYLKHQKQIEATNLR